MSNDLEQQLDEMGPEYRTVVARLRAAPGAEDLFTFQGLGLKSYLIAASLTAFVALAAVFVQSNNRTIEQSGNLSFPPREYCASVDEMIATQNPDGSWKNDFLTRRNAEALRACATPAATIAYKKAMRNLRAKGVL